MVAVVVMDGLETTVSVAANTRKEMQRVRSRADHGRMTGI